MADVDAIRLPQNVKDLSGKTIGRWTVVEYLGTEPGKGAFWKCRCECGTEKRVVASSLHQGKSRSCGCLQREAIVTVHTTHGMSYSAEYCVWHGMIERCTRENRRSYKRYGGRGITVCERWLNSFENFYADMGPRPSDGHSIERLYNNSGYCPSNCAWATDAEQSRNNSRTKMIAYNGKTMCIADWAATVGMSPQLLNKRIKSGWPMERALNPKLVRPGRR